MSATSEVTNSNRFMEAFLIEAHDLLAEIDQTALSLESEGATDEKVNKLFRAFHTIKGSGGICGLENIVNFTHHIENLLDLVRDGKIPVTPALVDLVLRSEDKIASLLAVEQGEPEPDPASTDKLIADLCAHAGLPVAAPQKKVKSPDADAVFLF